MGVVDFGEEDGVLDLSVMTKVYGSYLLRCLEDRGALWSDM